MTKVNLDAAANMAMDKHASKGIRNALLMAQALGKVEKSKEPVKPKFRDVSKRTHDAQPGECREMSNHGSWFYHLCMRNGVPCTRRQASKFLQKRGRAYAAKLQETRAESASTVALLGSVR